MFPDYLSVSYDYDERSSIFNNVSMYSMTNPCTLTATVFRLIKKDCKGAILEGPTCICDICWTFEFQKNLIKLKEPKNQTDIYYKCTTGKSDWICKSYHNSMMKNKVPMQVQHNNIELCPKFSELSSWVDVNFSNHTVYVYCWKDERCPAWT